MKSKGISHYDQFGLATANFGVRVDCPSREYAIGYLDKLSGHDGTAPIAGTTLIKPLAADVVSNQLTLRAI